MGNSINILFGDEPYLIDFKKAQILKGIDGMNLSEVDTFDENTLTLARTYPFLADMRGIVLRVDSIKSLDVPEFKEYAENPSEATRLVIIVRQIDKRVKLYKELDKKGFIVPCEKIKDKKSLEQAVLYEIQQSRGRITQDALNEFLNRMNYDEIEDMNLLKMKGYLNSLLIVSSDITLELVKELCPVFEVPNAVEFIGLILSKNSSELMRKLNMLTKDDAIGKLSLILRSYRIAYLMKYYSTREIGAYTDKRLNRLSSKQLQECISLINENILSIKTGANTPENALKNACVQLLARA